MYQVKMFLQDVLNPTGILEDDINNWLKENPKIEIISYDCKIVPPNGVIVFVTILYKTKKEVPY